jgi:hypothetical protein
MTIPAQSDMFEDKFKRFKSDHARFGVASRIVRNHHPINVSGSKGEIPTDGSQDRH